MARKIIESLIFAAFVLFAYVVGVVNGYRDGQKDAIATGRCQHERMANYDLVLAETECMELRKQIERTKESLAKSIEFMGHVKEKLGEAKE